MHCNALQGRVHSECSLKMTRANDKHPPCPLPSLGAIVDYLCVIGYLSQSCSGGPGASSSVVQKEAASARQWKVFCGLIWVWCHLSSSGHGAIKLTFRVIMVYIHIYIENSFVRLWIRGITCAWYPWDSTSCWVIVGGSRLGFSKGKWVLNGI